jgi:hypothetical protein
MLFSLYDAEALSKVWLLDLQDNRLPSKTLVIQEHHPLEYFGLSS